MPGDSMQRPGNNPGGQDTNNAVGKQVQCCSERSGEQDMLYRLASMAVGTFVRVGFIDGVKIGAIAYFTRKYLRDDGADRTMSAGMRSEHVFP
jgi:hypothetical protein